MPTWARITIRAAIGLVLFDLVGVVLTLVAQFIASIDIVMEWSIGAGYAVWFVTGVLCAAFIGSSTLFPEGGTTPSARDGVRLTLVTGIVVCIAGWLASFIWSDGIDGEAMVPDDRRLTITYLASVVTALATFAFLFRKGGDDRGRTAATDIEAGRDGNTRQTFMPARLPRAITVLATTSNNGERFSPAGPVGTVLAAFTLPMLLFLQTFWILSGVGPVPAHQQDLILFAALAGGAVWGVAAAHWPQPRHALLLAETPFIFGALAWFVGVLLGSVLAALGASDDVAGRIPKIGFWVGIAFGGGVLVLVAVAAWQERKSRQGRTVV